MKKPESTKKSGWRWHDTLCLILLLCIVLTKFSRPAADFYSTRLYPIVSGALSLVSSVFSFSLYDIILTLLIAGYIFLCIRSATRKAGWKRWLARTARYGAWVFIWFYAGWCINYGRSSIFERTGTRPQAFDMETFSTFLKEYTDSLNSTFEAGQAPSLKETEASVKAFYASIPSEYGLCRPKRWQHPKRMIFNRLYTMCGVTGYMGPLTGESHLCISAPADELPFLYAHEYSHLMGVSSEAEANWWAYEACTSSEDRFVRFLGYESVLPYVASNAHMVLDKESYRQWLSSVRPAVLAMEMERESYWRGLLSPTFSEIQSKIYSLFLKGNGIPSGIQNYSEVVRMIISLESVPEIQKVLPENANFECKSPLKSNLSNQ